MIYRIIIFVFVLFIGNFSYSQTIPVGNYKYKLDLTFGDPDHKCGCRNSIKLGLNFSDGNVDFLDTDVNCRPNGLGWSLDEKIISASRRLNGFYTVSSRNTDNGLGCGNSTGINDRYQFANVSSQQCNQYYTNIMSMPFNLFGNIVYSTTWYSNLNIKRTPQLTIVNPTPNFNYFEVDDPAGVIINSHTGFDVSEYRWYYKINKPNQPDTGWLPLASNFNGNSSISSLKITDVIPLNAKPKEYYGGRLEIRQEGCSVISNIKEYTLIKTPPLLVSQIPNISDTKCSYGSDGTATFTFGRNLEKDISTLLPSEHFVFNIYKRQDDYNNDINTSIPYINLTNDILLPNIFKDNYDDIVNKKNELGNFTPGFYYMRYSTKFDNPVAGNPSFVSAIIPSEPRSIISKSLYNSRTGMYDNVQVDTRVIPFTIKAPTPLIYTARMAQPKCSGGSAEIVINTKGGRPPYYYCINCTNDNSRIQFTNDAGVPYPDYGLPNGDYIITIPGSIPDGNISIKVTDSKNCVDPATQAPQ